jgi:hypothetical protein
MLTIFTIVDKNEDFIGLQYRSIKRFVIGDFEYIVFNNSSDTARRVKIKQICENLSIQCIDLFIEYRQTPSKIVADAINRAWETCIKHKNNFVLCMDSDMVFMQNFDVELIMNSADVLMLPIPRKTTRCLWSGLFCLNLSAIKDLNIDFSLGTIDGDRVDSGGFTHYWISRYKPKEVHISCRTLDDCSIELCRVGFDLQDPRVLSKANPEHKSLFKLFDKHFEIVNEFGFPKPYSFDLFLLNDSPIIFHYKSANWSDLYKKQDYADRKKIAYYNFCAKIFNDILDFCI